jgi:uncharacterized membrane protein
MKINYRIRLFAKEWKNVNNIVMMVILLIVQIVQERKRDREKGRKTEIQRGRNREIEKDNMTE